MKKKNVIKIVLTVLFSLLILAVIGFYVADILLNNTPPAKNLFRALAVVFVGIGGILRVYSNRGRRSLSYYESLYQEHLENAFTDDFLNRKKLLCAIRLYNENRMNKALKYLTELKAVCKTNEDLYAVGLFTALTLTDAGMKEEAITVYDAMIRRNLANTTVYGNLGYLHSDLGNSEEALNALKMAIDVDPKNPAPYNNLGNMYFTLHDFESAKEYALKALEVNHKFYQASTLLAIIYSLEGDRENTEKYSHMAAASGQNPTKLKDAIKYYRSAVPEKELFEEQEEE